MNPTNFVRFLSDKCLEQTFILVFLLILLCDVAAAVQPGGSLDKFTCPRPFRMSHTTLNADKFLVPIFQQQISYGQYLLKSLKYFQSDFAYSYPIIKTIVYKLSEHL